MPSRPSAAIFLNRTPASSDASGNRLFIASSRDGSAGGAGALGGAGVATAGSAAGGGVALPGFSLSNSQLQGGSSTEAGAGVEVAGDVGVAVERVHRADPAGA